MKFKIGSTVKHAYFGTGIVLGYESLRCTYTVLFGKDPGFRRNVNELKLEQVMPKEPIQSALTKYE